MATVSTDQDHQPSTAAVQAELQRVLDGPVFAQAQAHQRLLRYLVEHSLAGHSAMLKETVLGIEVFYRPAARFDPRQDSIVRVEARRLRTRLAQHYAAHADSPVRIGLPKGSYRPQFVWHTAAQPLLTSPAQQRAVELVERGLFFLRQGHQAGHRAALARFEAAVLAAPDLAAAHTGVARAWTQLVATNIEPPNPGIEYALAAVQRALALQPLHAESLVLAAQLRHRFAFDWPAASALYAQALRAVSAPSVHPAYPAQPAHSVPPAQSAYVLHSHAMALMLRADFEGAEKQLGVARQIDPLNLGLRAHGALLALYRRQWDSAEATLQGLLDMAPDNVLGLSLLAYVALCRGQHSAALALYQQVSALHATMSIGPVGVVMALAADGQTVRARQALQALQRRWRTGPASPGGASRRGYLSPYQLAMAELRLGAVDAALALLVRAVQERDPNAVCLPVDPAFDSLHGMPAFKALRAQVLGEVVE